MPSSPPPPGLALEPTSVTLKAWAAEASTSERTPPPGFHNTRTHCTPALEVGDWGSKHLCGQPGCVCGLCASSHVTVIICVSLSLFIHDGGGCARVHSTVRVDVHTYHPVFVHERVCQCAPVSLCECRPQSPIPPPGSLISGLGFVPFPSCSFPQRQQRRQQQRRQQKQQEQPRHPPTSSQDSGVKVGF